MKSETDTGHSPTRPSPIDDARLKKIAAAAWEARENAHILGDTKVGCGVLTDKGEMYVGCNVEHMFRCHDIHAEVNAIGTMIAAVGRQVIVAVVIVAERDRFTPCGGCMDWIMQFGSTETAVLFQPGPEAGFQRYSAGELMPHYPR